MKIEIYGYSALGNRQENEDSFDCQQFGDDGLYAIVADGLGGHGGGKEASGIAVKVLRNCEPLPSLPTEEQLLKYLEEANQEIISKRNSPSHMKTTVVFLFVKNGQAVWGHIGDSRLYHFYNGRLANYTLDHSVCQIKVKLGEITRREISEQPDRNKLLKVLGDNTISPEIHPAVELAAGRHAFLLCTDGLWERLQEDEILLDLHKCDTPEQWVTSLRRRAEIRKHSDVDNNTAAAVFIDEEKQ